MTDTTDFDRQVEANLPWNFSVNLFDIAFITLGLSIVSRETVMPLLVSNLTSSKMAIGLIPAIYALGYYLPQLFSSNFAGRLRRSKPFVMVVGGFWERGPYLLMALAIWLLAPVNPTVALIVFFLLLATTAASAGIATPPWFNMISKVIPVRRRGLFYGVGLSLGAFMGILGAVLVGRVLEGWAYPTNFAILFALGSVAIAVSWLGLALNREPESPVVKEHISQSSYFKQLPTILRNNQNYTRFLISHGTARLGAMAAGFFLVFGVARFDLSGAQVGMFTGILVGSQAIANLLWGLVGDRQGHKTVLAGAAFAMALAALMAWIAVSPLWLALTFVLLGVAMAGDAVSGMNIILEFCAPEDRPTYIGLTNTLLAPVIVLAPLLGGWLATGAGYQPMFFVATIFACLGGLLLVLWVREPRLAQLETAGAAP